MITREKVIACAEEIAVAEWGSNLAQLPDSTREDVIRRAGERVREECIREWIANARQKQPREATLFEDRKP